MKIDVYAHLLLATLFVALAGCLDVQLNGPVSNAHIQVSSLRDSSAVLIEGSSAGEAEMEERLGETRWQETSTLGQLIWLGTFIDIDTSSIAADSLYLVTVTGGSDEDVDRNLERDATATPVQMPLRAILTGAQLSDAATARVSVLTEAVYRWLEPSIDSLSDDAIVSFLDRAAASLVSETTDTAQFNYADLLAWSRLYNASTRFNGDMEQLNAFSQALLDGADDSDLYAMANSLVNVLTGDRPNILLIVADDIGVDILSTYGEQPNHAAQTPNIDALADGGVLFRNAWANPMCSPSRASLLTGRHAFRHGVTHPGGATGTLAESEQTFAEVLADVGYSAALFGKWHLGSGTGNLPTDQGFSYYSGSLSNLEDYNTWSKTVISAEGASQQTVNETGYATEIVADEALTWIEQASEPWLVEVAFNAPHSPYHVPPQDTYTSVNLQGAAGEPCTNSSATDEPVLCYRAAAEAMDYYTGQLLAQIPASTLANTVIIFLGDNGTPGNVIVEEAGLPFDRSHGKSTVYEGGVNIPIIISAGDAVPIDPREITDLIQIQDLFATIVDLGQAAPDSEAVDGRSLLNYLSKTTTDPALRGQLFTELYSDVQGIDRWAISNGDAKYIYNEGTQECYSLSADPGEQVNDFGSDSATAMACMDLRTDKPD